MSKRREETRKALSAEDKRALDLRRAFLIFHVIFEVLLVVGVKLGWYTIYVGNQVLASVSPGDGLHAAAGSVPLVDQARWLVIAAVVAFFFTSYDLVANADFQWAPLLASAFAVGICGQVCYQLSDWEAKFRGPVELALQAKMRRGELPSPTPAPVAPVSSGTSSTASQTTAGNTASPGGSTAPAGSASSNTPKSTEAQDRLTMDFGLKLCAISSFFMVVLSTYMTFFARRAT